MLSIHIECRQITNESSVRPGTTFTPRDVEKHLNILNVLNRFSEGSDKVSIGRPLDVRRTEKINVNKTSGQDVYWTSKNTFRRRPVNVGLLYGYINLGPC